MRQKRGEQIPLSLIFCSSQTLNGLDGDAHPHWGAHSPKCTNSNANLIEKHLHRHAQVMFNLGAPWSVKLTLKLTMTSPWSLVKCLALRKCVHNDQQVFNSLGFKGPCQVGNTVLPGSLY